MPKNARAIAAIAALGFLLAGCGTDPGDRMVSGGLLGAGAGAAIGSVAGGAGTGAIIGGVGGAALGALTSPRALNLGDPPWRSHYSHSASSRHHYRCHWVSEDEKVCKRA